MAASGGPEVTLNENTGGTFDIQDKRLKVRRAAPGYDRTLPQHPDC